MGRALLVVARESLASNETPRIRADRRAQDVPLEDVQYLAGHADPRTTRLYDRRHWKVTRNIVERISVKGLEPQD